MTLRLTFIFRIVFCLCISHYSFSQQYNFRNYSLEQGLSQSQVYAICEDVKGNLWFGTRGGGLNRFDGLTFTPFTVQEGLASNYIKSIIRDQKGNLCIGTDNGISKYDGKSFTNYDSTNGLYNRFVNDLLLDKKGVLWIATEKGIFHLEGDTIIRFGRKINGPMERVSSLEEDLKGNIWAGTDFGLYQFSPDKNEWKKKVFTYKDGLPNNIVNAICKNKAGELWICTYGGGVAKLHSSGFEVYNSRNGLFNNTVFTCFPEENGDVWFGTAYGIVKAVARDNGYSFTAITETEGLANNVVMAIRKDSYGNLWFGTSGGGISKLDSERFKHFTAIKGLMGSWVYSIAQDTSGNMWFATSEGGVTQYNNTIYKRFSERNGFTSSKIKHIVAESNGQIWFGTIADGLYWYDGDNFFHYNTRTGLSSNFINYILPDTSGNIWLATAGGGISLMIPDRQTQQYRVKIIKPKDGLGSDRIHTLVKDQHGVIWAGAANGKISKISYVEAEDKFLIQNQNSPSSGIRCGLIDNKNKIYFGTSDQGILVFEDDNFQKINKENGLSSNNIYSIIFDLQGNLWVGTEKGIDKITFDSEGKIVSIRSYGRSEGFTGIETMQNASYLDKDGNIWFGTVRSATMYNPSKEKNISQPRVHISGINLFFDKIESTPYGQNLSPWYPIPETLSLPYDQNHISFEFIGIEMSNPEAVRYRWKLEGFDEDWSPVTSRREAVYSNLPPGNYIFQVIACNERKEWTDSPVTFSFVIHPPVWKTWWFRVLAIGILFLIIFLILYYSFKRIRKENERERLKLESEKSLIELEQKALRLQMNPHFLFNCLNSIKGLIAENKQEEAKLYLSRFAKLMRAMLDNSMESFIPLESEIASLKNYADLEKLSREDKFDFIIELENGLDSSFIKIPPMLIQPFVENAIIHGIAPKTQKGKVSVYFEREGDYLKAIIEDDGIGRVKAAELKEKSVQSHKSAAISVTQERLNILNKKLNFGEVKIVIVDLNDQGEAKGTRVELLLPYQEI